MSPTTSPEKTTVMPQQPPQAATTDSRHHDFLPQYEATLNTNLRSFSQLEAQTGIQPFDHIQEPQRRTRWKEKKTIVSVVAMICLLALAGICIYGLAYSGYHGNSNDENNIDRHSGAARDVVISTTVRTEVVVETMTISASFVTVSVASSAASQSSFADQQIASSSIAEASGMPNWSYSPLSATFSTATLMSTSVFPEETISPSTTSIVSQSTSDDLVISATAAPIPSSAPAEPPPAPTTPSTVIGQPAGMIGFCGTPGTPCW